MSRKDARFTTHHQGDDRARQGTVSTRSSASLLLHREVIRTEAHSPPNWWTVQLLLQLQLLIFAKRSLARPDRLAGTILRMERALEHVERCRVLDWSETDDAAQNSEEDGLERPTTREKSEKG